MVGNLGLLRVPVRTATQSPASDWKDVVVPSESLIARYELLGQLGRGGMAEVWLARAIGLRDFEKILVLKRILRDKSDDPRFIGMLRDEARVAATLDHPNIVHTFDVGLQGEELFISMEYLHGETVKSILAATRKAGEQMPLELAVQVAMGCAAGLHYAHEQTDSGGRPLNIVHRDVSPSNVIVTHHSGVKLIDFGIAKAKSRKEQTAVGMLKGKAAYMSPEQCKGDKLDRRSDVFALGIMMYEMTATVRPFEGESHLAIMHQICNENPRPPGEFRKGYPEPLARVVMRALERDPDKRHQSAFELLEELERVTRDTKLHALPGALARYLEHLFGPRPHPWQLARQQAIAAGRTDFDTTQTSEKEEVRPHTSTITQPKLAASVSSSSESSPTSGPAFGTRTGAAGSSTRGVVTEPAGMPIVSEDELAITPRAPRQTSSALIVGGSVAVAAVLVGVAAYVSGDSKPAAPTVQAAVQPSAKEQVAPEPAPEPTPPPAPSPSAETPTLPPPSSPESPPTKEEDDILVQIEEPAPTKARATTDKKKSAAKLAEEAEKVLDQARKALLERDYAKALKLADKSLLLHRSPAGYQLLGTAACTLGNEKVAKRAHRNLKGVRRSDLAKVCSVKGIELE